MQELLYCAYCTLSSLFYVLTQGVSMKVIAIFFSRFDSPPRTNHTGNSMVHLIRRDRIPVPPQMHGVKEIVTTIL